MVCGHLRQPKRVCGLTAVVVGWGTGVHENVCEACEQKPLAERIAFTRMRIQAVVDARVKDGSVTPAEAVKIMEEAEATDFSRAW